jgi:predicted component of type VI protein secretion system
MSSQFSIPGQDKKANPTRAGAELAMGEFGTFTIGGIATIGRAPESDVVLNARSVSRNHARIFYEGGHYWIKDLGSANGTTVNGKKVVLQMLANSDTIVFGDAKGIFHTAEGILRPAPLAQDPLEGMESGFADGTPTGKICGPVPHETNPARTQASAFSGSPELQALTRKVEALQTENKQLRQELMQYRTGTASAATAAVPQGNEEVARLKVMISRLERALGDSNVRIRSLQQLLDSKK